MPRQNLVPAKKTPALRAGALEVLPSVMDYAGGANTVSMTWITPFD